MKKYIRSLIGFSPVFKNNEINYSQDFTSEMFEDSFKHPILIDLDDDFLPPDEQEYVLMSKNYYDRVYYKALKNFVDNLKKNIEEINFQIINRTKK